MQQIFSNTTLTVNQLIEKIDTGELGLPELQRPFIWKDSKVRDLFDSMMCGYPIVASTVRRAKLAIRDDNSELVWVMAYPKAEYAHDADAFDAYYDHVEVCEGSARSHPKAAIQVRNRCMVDRSDLVVCYVDHDSGGAFQTMAYAEKTGKSVINIAVPD